MTQMTPPPFDPELAAALDAAGAPSTITPEMVPALRQAYDLTFDDVRGDLPLRARDIAIPGLNGESITVSVISREDHTGTGTGIYHVHGGGMMLGNRFFGLGTVLEWVAEFDAVCVTVDYRLVPEFPDPYPVEDAYAGLTWTAAHTDELGIDISRILVVGGSAGGGLAAAIALLARDRGGPTLLGQVLMYPMLDDRDATNSTHQIDGIGVWDRRSNITGWTALLGVRRASDSVSIYAAPARATNLAGLPPAFIDVGTTEVFRDEDVAYASALWAQGVSAELHVWPGGFHGFDLVAPDAALSRAMTRTRAAWVSRLLRT